MQTGVVVSTDGDESKDAADVANGSGTDSVHRRFASAAPAVLESLAKGR